jgi:hypothetical protein
MKDKVQWQLQPEPGLCGQCQCGHTGTLRVRSAWQEKHRAGKEGGRFWGIEWAWVGSTEYSLLQGANLLDSFG